MSLMCENQGGQKATNKTEKKRWQSMNEKMTKTKHHEKKPQLSYTSEKTNQWIHMISGGLVQKPYKFTW